MLSRRNTRPASARPSLPPPTNLCTHGCQKHIKRLEELNRQLARENDRLRREIGEGERAA